MPNFAFFHGLGRDLPKMARITSCLHAKFSPRLLKREGMSGVEEVIPKAERKMIQAKKSFEDYEPSFVHIDIKYLSRMPDETSRSYLFVAIDRATRWAFLHIYLNGNGRASRRCRPFPN